jgi:CRISPR-associated protein Csx3
LHLTSGDAQAEFTVAMSPTRLDVAGLSMILYPASRFEAGLAGMYLRPREAGAAPVPLLGPGSEGTTSLDGEAIVRRGYHGSLDWLVEFSFGPDGHDWRWQAELHNGSAKAFMCDLVITQDFALAPYGAVRTNEYYVSQYLDLSVITDPEFGNAVAVRQNMPGDHQPWAVLGSLGRGTGWSTDALQLRKLHNGRPVLDVSRLPSTRLQHEHTLAALASDELVIGPGETLVAGFFGAFVADHPAATGPADAALVHRVRAASLERSTTRSLSLTKGLNSTTGTMFDSPVAPASPLSEATAERWFPGGRDLVELAPDGLLWAFRTQSGEHVTAREKELAVLRPHGQILRTGDGITPEEGTLTSTVWMRGVFASQVTTGHVSLGGLVSGDRTYLGLQDAHGLRAFIRRASVWELLDVPTAWTLGLDGARWLYDLAGSEVEVTTRAVVDAHRLDFTVRTDGDIDQVLLAVQLALGDDDGQTAEPITVAGSGPIVTASGGGGTLRIDFGDREVEAGGDELLFADGESRGLPWLCIALDAPVQVTFALTGEAATSNTGPEPVRLPGLWSELRDGLSLGGTTREKDVVTLDAILPWFAHDALIHYLSPRGLEQYTGGAWGTRDVCQGPVGLLTAHARDDALRDVLLRIFRDQNDRGDWPQAFDFLPSAAEVSQSEAHGDVVYWPLLALGDYLLTTGDSSLLAEERPGRGNGARTAPTPIAEHVRRALDHIESTLVGATPLPAYGHGDWNDSLQPADPRLASNMVSTWTATLQCQALSRLAEGLRTAGAEPELATRCADLAAATRASVGELLLADGVLSGYAVFDGDPAAPELLVHPRDSRTGLTYGVLPWIQAIAGDQVTPEQARHHLDLLHAHLWGPDGARLFDKPPVYRGGPMEVFKRAEAATFWGREIGLMYTHAHLRYCEALARVGDAQRLWDGLLLAVPLGLSDRVLVARPRQTTCYYSSSDAAFADRAEAGEHYADIARGLVPLEGGWRVYSSGPGLFLRLVVECLLGVRRRPDALELDPVLAPGLDGLEAQVPYPGGPLTVRYRVRGTGHGVQSVLVDGIPVELTPLANPYRRPGVSVPRSAVRPGSVIDVEVGR